MTISFKVISKEEAVVGNIATYTFTCEMVSETERGVITFNSTNPDSFNFLLVDQTYDCDITEE